MLKAIVNFVVGVVFTGAALSVAVTWAYLWQLIVPSMSLGDAGGFGLGVVLFAVSMVFFGHFVLTIVREIRAGEWAVEAADDTGWIQLGENLWAKQTD